MWSKLPNNMRRCLFACLAACASSLPNWVQKQDSRINTLCAFAKNPSDQQVAGALFGTDADMMTYVPTDGLHLIMQYGCLSSSCDRKATMTCTTSVNAHLVTVLATVKWEHDDNSLTCTADCGFAQAACDTGPLEQGLYQVVLADRTMSVTTSGTQTVPCSRLQ